jgi:RNA polymerase sigma factor FliA
MATQMETVEILDEFLMTRSPELREKLVLQSVPLVHYLLGRMGMTQEMGTEYEDLAHQGLMGLIEAVDHFDPKFNARFSTYASLRIRGKILDYLRTSDWMPRAARKRARQIQKTITTFCSEHQREPTEDEIASRLGIKVDEIQQGLADSNRVLVSLDTLMESGPEGDGSSYEYLKDENQANPEEALVTGSLIEEMGSAIRNLSEREQLVLSLYYNDELTFKEIGKVLEITESRVCQLHARTILSLKAMMSHE